MAGMNEQLFKQLFPCDPSPTKLQKKTSNTDILNSLFYTQLPPSKPKQNELSRKSKGNQQHQYVKLAELSNDKAKKSVQRMVEEKTLTPEQIRTKRKIQKVTIQFEKEKKQASGEKKIYMPTVVDPFAKVSDKDKNDKKSVVTSASAPVKIREKETVKTQKERNHDNHREKERQEKSKIQAKKLKIERKQEQRRAMQKKELQHKRKHLNESKKLSFVEQPIDNNNWRQQLRKITNYDPHNKKFQMRDQTEIIQSGVDRMFGQDRFSSRMGKIEQQQDMKRQLMMKKRKDDKFKHRT